MRALIGAALFVAACGGAPAARPTSSSTPAAPLATPSTIPQIDVSGMMGAFPPATFFVVRPSEIQAIALLNHATKYAIPIASRDAQLAASDSGRLYVLDQTGDAVRLRWFDVSNGSERAQQIVFGASVVATGTAHGTLAFDRTTGEVLALLRSGDRMSVEEFEGFSLRPVRRRLGDLVCGDRLVADGGRYALGCFADGLLVAGDDRTATKFGSGMPLVAMAMSANGTLVSAAADGTLFRLRPVDLLRSKPEDLETIATLREHPHRVVSDGLAFQANCCIVVATTEGVSNTQVQFFAGGITLLAIAEVAPPNGGIFVQPPFAYWTNARGEARHIDLDQRFEEVMASHLGTDVRPGAVADR